VEILTILTILLLLLVISAGALVRSYFVRGRLRGMQEATVEIIRGANSHFEAGSQPPAGVLKALEVLNAGGGFPQDKQLERRHAHLWVFGDAVGSACWNKGYRSGKLTMAPRDGKIFVELSPNELLQLTWLAHLGFLHMMPNYRSFETHRFSGEEDARDGAKAVDRLEVSVPVVHRPVENPIALSNARLALIENWWASESKFASA
jgi:hypothetical protein